MPSLLQLQDLYNEALIRELLEKTKRCAVTWSQLGTSQFHATETDSGPPTVNWDFYITKTQVGNLSYKYSVDVKKNSTTYITIQDGPLPHTARDSAVKDLYEIIEIMVLQLDLKVKETIRFVQELKGCTD